MSIYEFNVQHFANFYVICCCRLLVTIGDIFVGKLYDLFCELINHSNLDFLSTFLN